MKKLIVIGLLVVMLTCVNHILKLPQPRGFTPFILWPICGQNFLLPIIDELLAPAHPQKTA
jgi:hypothetical protein